MIRAIKGELIGANHLQLEIKEGFLKECLELTCWACNAREERGRVSKTQVPVGDGPGEVGLWEPHTSP